jgi:hypothetical protein
MYQFLSIIIAEYPKPLIFSAIAILGIIACVVGTATFVSVSRARFATLLQSYQVSAPVKTPLSRDKDDAADIDYPLVFPPSQRKVLAQFNSFAGGTILHDPDIPMLKTGLLKLEDDYRLAEPSRFICTGFRVGDVRTLGQFPDHAALSGVPLPGPIENFNINKAAARPYRPFRWEYHQTMCK